MLEYFKIILSKVSFDKKLFERELRKAIKSLLKDELNELKNWCYAQFGKVYGPIIDRQFVLTQ
ncbi:MAG: hypothetical protein ACJAVN_000764 [Roseivirga sp.]|jgi:hypothetical protein